MTVPGSVVTHSRTSDDLVISRLAQCSMHTNGAANLQVVCFAGLAWIEYFMCVEGRGESGESARGRGGGGAVEDIV